MKKIISVLIIISLSSTLVGCWDSTETEKLGVVTLLGIGLDNDNFRIVVQEISGNRNIESNNVPFHVYDEYSFTISEAIQKISLNEHLKIYFGHTKIIVISEELASSKGIMPVIDFFQRDPEIRPTAMILISKRGQFDKIFNAQTGLNADTGSILEEMIKNKKNVSFTTANNIKDFVDLLDTPGTETYTSGISVGSKDSAGKETNNNSMSNMANKVFSVQDIAIFKDKKLIGWLKDDELKGFLWINGNVKGGLISIPLKNKTLSLKIAAFKSKIDPVIIDNKIGMNINIKITSNISESQTNIDFMDKSIINEAEQIQSEKIKKEILEAFDKSVDFKCDVFGFGNFLNMKYPKYWRNVQNNWYSHYQNISINIYVDSLIKNVEKIFKPLNY